MKFSGALTLTYNATSMILPKGADLQTSANDTAILAHLGSGNWQVISYNKADGQGGQQPGSAGLLHLGLRRLHAANQI